MGRSLESATVVAESLPTQVPLQPHLGFACDMSCSSSINDFCAGLAAREVTPTVLVNCAGITKDGPLLRSKDSDLEDIMRTNLLGPIRLSRALLKGMVKKKEGCIVNVGSVVATSGNIGQSFYGGSKAGLFGAVFFLEVVPVDPFFLNTHQGFPNLSHEKLLIGAYV